MKEAEDLINNCFNIQFLYAEPPYSCWQIQLRVQPQRDLGGKRRKRAGGVALGVTRTWLVRRSTFLLGYSEECGSPPSTNSLFHTAQSRSNNRLCAGCVTLFSPIGVT